MQALHTASVEMEQEGNTNQLCDLTASLIGFIYSTCSLNT